MRLSESHVRAESAAAASCPARSRTCRGRAVTGPYAPWTADHSMLSSDSSKPCSTPAASASAPVPGPRHAPPEFGAEVSLLHRPRVRVPDVEQVVLAPDRHV